MAILFERNREGALVSVKDGSLDFKEQRILVCLPGDYVSSFPTSFLDSVDRDSYRQEVGVDIDDKEKEFKKAANGMLKMSERMLGGKSRLRQTDRIVMAAYPFDFSVGPRTSNAVARDKYNYKDPENYFSDYAKNFVENDLVKLIGVRLKVKFGKGQPQVVGYKLQDDKHLPVEELSENMSRLTFMGFSHGAVFAGEICNCLKKIMREVGYEENAIKQSLKHVNVMAIASVAQTAKPETNYFTMVHFQAENDFRVKNILPDIKFSDAKKTKPYLLKPADNCLRVIGKNQNIFDYFGYEEKENVFKHENELEERLADAHKKGYKDVTEADITQEFHTLRAYGSIKKNSLNTVEIMTQNCLRNMFYRDVDINSIEQNLIRERARSPEMPEQYKNASLDQIDDVIKEDLAQHRNINESYVVQLMRSAYNEHIKDIVAEFRGEGIFKGK